MAVAAPLGITIGYVADAPTLLTLALTALAMYLSTWSDWDHPVYDNREYHIGAAAIRLQCKYAHRIKTEKDVVREARRKYQDHHRKLTHSVEWCLFISLIILGYSWLLPLTSNYYWLFGLAAFAGSFSHVLLDWTTKSGVPLSLIYNYFVHKQLWKRHTLGLTTTGSGAEYIVTRVMWLVTGLYLLWLLNWLETVLGGLTGLDDHANEIVLPILATGVLLSIYKGWREYKKSIIPESEWEEVE